MLEAELFFSCFFLWHLESSKCRKEDMKCITELPQECVSHILKLTSPLVPARSALISAEFRSAANSDTVSNSFLPPDYEEMLSKLETPLVFSSKKDLYFQFCKGPLPIGENRLLSFHSILFMHSFN